MRKIIFSFITVFVFISCQKEIKSPNTSEKKNATEDQSSLASGRGPNIAICHRTQSGSWISIVIPESALSAHLAHGDIIPDEDEDGYTKVTPCGTGSQDDCNDTDPAIHPGATEICGNSIDENCNGMADDACSLSIGDAYGGGIIAYIDGTGLHGLIAAPSDQSSGAEWGCLYYEIYGADGKAIGTGNDNTIDIMAGCTEPGIAASLCANLVLGGYDDWYLPSKDELHQLYINRVAIGGFDSPSEYYWSSSEFIEEFPEAIAWSQKFLDGYPPVGEIKYLPLGVRAVRTF